jgi:hypothetical protein
MVVEPLRHLLYPLLKFEGARPSRQAGGGLKHSFADFVGDEPLPAPQALVHAAFVEGRKRKGGGRKKKG